MTGLTGNYDFALQWKPDYRQPAKGAGSPSAPEPADLAIVPAIQQQLGLKLEPRRVFMEILVIDHVEKPSGN